MATTVSPTPLDQPIAAWLAHQRALGRRYDPEEWIVNSLRTFMGQTSEPDLDQASFDHWCATFPHLASNTLLYRQRVVRRFCLHRRRKEPGLCARSLALRPTRAVPAARRHRAGANRQDAYGGGQHARVTGLPLRPAVYRMAVILLYTTGLRRGELLRLTLADCESESGVLRVENPNSTSREYCPCRQTRTPNCGGTCKSV